MSWIERLCETYDACMSMAGTLNDDAVLIPVAHSTANAQIEVFLNTNGEIIKDACNTIEKDGKNEVTIIPVTEDSATRTASNAPHPLHDKLCYIAGDYVHYTGDVERVEYYKAYINQLTKWVESPYGNEYIKTVLTYLEKGSLIKDLAELNLLVLDEEEKLTDANKIHNLGQTGAVVRFGIVTDDGEVWKAWESKVVFDSWEKFYIPQVGFDDICFVSGQMEKCAAKHPNKIRNSGDKAKLISGNDKAGFTFRGRFFTKDEAATVGYVASQKAHNALRWLIARQGYKKDGCAIVIWKIPDSSKSVTRESFSVPDIFELNDFSYYVTEDDVAEDIDTGKAYAIELEKAITGRRELSESDEKVIIMAVDAATQGRMSIEYYQEFGYFEFLNSIRKWYENAAWNRVVKDYEADKYIRVIMAPTPREIALAAYGIDRGGYLDTDAAHIKYATKRIIPVILGIQKEIPKDIKREIMNNVSRTHAYSSFVWEQKILAVAYSLLNYEGAFNNMQTDINKERSILWGRLLAVIDEIEKRSRYIAEKSGSSNDRLTNAKKYWGKFQRTPMTVYNQLYNFILQGYARRLSPDARSYFENEIGKLIARLYEIDGFDNQPLDENYLVGYYQQGMKFRKRNENEGEN